MEQTAYEQVIARQLIKNFPIFWTSSIIIVFKTIFHMSLS